MPPRPTLPHLLSSPEGHAALAAVLRLAPLMAFDFDGTLAPIVARPQDVQISPEVVAPLRALAERLPVAVVTGRALADVRDRLGFTPHYLVGSHGAEDEDDPAGMAAAQNGLDGLRAVLQQQAAALAAAGVLVEDKRLSLALHYRQAPDTVAARALIDALLAPLAGGLQLFGGKMVVNAMVAGAPDKAQAVRTLLARCGARAAFFAGDDVNDEPVFEAAPAHWLTVRIGRNPPHTRARFGLDGPHEMVLLLQQVLALLDAPRPA
jgi:trehalose 6-phosphate phosphatase